MIRLVFHFVLFVVGNGSWMLVWGQKPELVVQLGHANRVHAVAFSPDGQYILTGSEDQTAKLWDLHGRELQSFNGHSSIVSSVAFSYDGQFILTGSLDKTAKLWDLHGRELQHFPGHHSSVESITFSPDGQYIVTGSYGMAKLWDLNGRELQSFSGHNRFIRSVSFSPDGQYILTGSADNTAKLWGINGRELQTFKGHSSTVLSVAFSPNGDYLLTGSEDQTAKLWDLNGQEIQSYNGHSSWILSVAFSPDGQHILTGSEDQTAKLWDLNGQQLQSFTGPDFPIRAITFSPNGQMILTGGDDFGYGKVNLWNLYGRQLQSLKSPSSWISSVAFSPDGQHFLTGGGDKNHGEIKLWDLNMRDVLSFKVHRSAVLSVAFSQDENYILTGSMDKTAKLWDLHGHELQNFNGHSRSVRSVAFSPDGQYILTGSWDQTAKLWDLNGKELQSYRHSSYVYDVAFSPNGQHILTGSGDVDYGEAKLWDLNGRELQTFKDHSAVVLSVAFSPDGHYILTSSRDKTTKLWDLNGLELQTFRGHSDWHLSATFSPDGNHILTGSRDRTAKMWDLNGRELQSFLGHIAEVRPVSYAPGGQCFLSGSMDQTAKLWDTSTGENILTFIGFSKTDDSWIIVNPSQYYMKSRKLVNFVHFKIGLTAYNFDQFDLRLNRPDKILETLLPFGADSNLMLQYRHAYFKRLEKYGFTEDMLSDDFHVPECTIQNQDNIPISTADSLLQLQIQAIDTLRPLDRLNVFVNDVPIYGIQGINLRDQNTQEYTTTLDIPLSRGSNKIQVSALNQGGAESLKATTYITYEAPEAKPDLYLITIGVSDYLAKDKDLQYAAKDARDIASLYENTDAFNQTHIKTLTDNQVTKSNILALKDWLQTTQVEDQVLIYVSGHGLLDENYDFYYATHDIDFTNPSDKGILYDEIEGLLDAIPARRKLLLMDACHSGEYDADTQPMNQTQLDSLKGKGISFKGFTKGDNESGPKLGLQNSFEMMQQLFADLRRGSGATVISSSSGVQVSYEKGEWQNGAFTYAFLYGLKSMKADANGDGKVTASEIQTFVGEYVPRLTEGLQKPTFRRENLEFDFRVW